MAKIPKEKKCVVCGQYFQPLRPLQKVCSPKCAIAHSQALARKKREKADKQARLENRKKMTALKEKLKSKHDLTKEAQAAVNKYIRLRDNGKPCISCGIPLQISGFGGGFDAGHYRSRGSAPQLRFYTLNIFGQCKQCNRYKGGNYAAFRKGLIARIGLAKVEAIEADQRSRHYTEQDLRRIKQIFNKKCRLVAKRKG